MCFSASYPERVDRLVLGDIGPEIDPKGADRIQHQVREQDVFASVDEAYALLASHDPYADPHALRSRIEHNVRELPDGSLTWKYDVALRDGTAQYENFGRDELWALWTAVERPVLILRGEHSDILSEDVTARMLAANPHAHLEVLEHAGHSIATDVPEVVGAAIRRFIDFD
jgi:pimeloyl-ACP methyl ester carboxylesterase